MSGFTSSFARSPPSDFAALRARVFENPLYINALISENESLTIIAVKPFAFSTKTPDLADVVVAPALMVVASGSKAGSGKH